MTKRKLTSRRKALFIETLAANGGIVTGAAELVGVSRRRLYSERDSDREFAAAWAEAVERGIELLEAEAFRRAHDGVDEPQFYQGVVCGTVRKYSDALLIFLLKSKRPAVYRDYAKVEVERTDKQGPKWDLSKLTDEELFTLKELQEKATPTHDRRKDDTPGANAGRRAGDSK